MAAIARVVLEFRWPSSPEVDSASVDAVRVLLGAGLAQTEEQATEIVRAVMLAVLRVDRFGAGDPMAPAPDEAG